MHVYGRSDLSAPVASTPEGAARAVALAVALEVQP